MISYGTPISCTFRSESVEPTHALDFLSFKIIVDRDGYSIFQTQSFQVFHKNNSML